jgi:hypothetical protein
MAMKKAALILLAAGAAAIGSGGAEAQKRPSVCPSAGNSKAPFYGVTATHIGRGKELRVAGNYRLKERNHTLTLTKSAESSTLLKLRLRSIYSSGHAAGCPHFGGSFRAASSVQRVQITDWKSKRITVRVARPPRHAYPEAHG